MDNEEEDASDEDDWVLGGQAGFKSKSLGLSGRSHDSMDKNDGATGSDSGEDGEWDGDDNGEGIGADNGKGEGESGGGGKLLRGGAVA